MLRGHRTVGVSVIINKEMNWFIIYYK